MAWGRPDVDPSELMGMTKEELAAKLAEGAEAKAKLADIEAGMNTGFSELRASLEALKAPPAPPVERNNPDPTNFFENPDQAFNERMAPLAGATLRTQGRLEMMEARQRYTKDFHLWGKEITDLIDSEQNLYNKTLPNFYENCVNIVRGRHAKEIEESAAKGISLFTEPAGGGMPGGVSDDPKAASVARLSQDQLTAAKRFGMTPAEFADNLAYVESSYGHTKGGSIVH